MKATDDSTPAGSLHQSRKRHVIANVAVARDLADWCWSLAVMEDSHSRYGFVATAAGSSAWSDARNSMISQRDQ